jgi:2-polyprenyl-3-methyl-5-hydroxy-6-metoxy-1,4-benzoquinol methylase
MRTSGAPRTAREAYAVAMVSRIDTPEIPLGPWASYDLVNDPRRLAFVLARYKFCARMLEGRRRVLEVGCGDALGLPIVAQAVDELVAVDWDPRQLEGNARRLPHLANVRYRLHDFNEGPLDLAVDAIYWIDVLEHLEPAREARFLENLVACLAPGGVLVTGTPNLTAAAYASPQSRIHHINLKDHASLRALTERYFENAFLFGMNDEVLHTGFGPMCHYLWSLGVGPRRR